jgi:toxin secretion/phage lysis holin
MNLFVDNKLITYCLTALGYIPACFIGLSIESYAILGVLLIVDTATGITRSIFNDGGRAVTSRKFATGVIKKAHMVIIPWLVLVAGQGMGVDLLIFAKAVLGALIASELYSILGNVYSIYTEEDKPEFDGVKFVMSSTMNGIKNLLQNIVKGIK